MSIAPSAPFETVDRADVAVIFVEHECEARLRHQRAEGSRANRSSQLMDLILQADSRPEIETGAPLQMLVTTLDWSDYVGRIAVGRIYSGEVRAGHGRGADAGRRRRHARHRSPRCTSSRTSAAARSIGRRRRHRRRWSGLENVKIGDTVSDRNSPRAMPRVVVDEPTLQMTFGVNTSPLAGRDGQIRHQPPSPRAAFQRAGEERGPAGRAVAGTEQFAVSGRGVLHLSVLIETMRREGYELSIGKPHVIFREHTA